MAGQTYRMPALGDDVQVLKRENDDGQALTPDTQVLCIHRGRHIIRDKFDGVDYEIAPGKFIAPYGAVQLFRDHAVIPGTRNPELGYQQSYIGIIGIDDPRDCEPLTDEEVKKFGAKVEAIDRDALVDPDAREVRIETTKGGGQARRAISGNRRPQLEVSDPSAMDKPESTIAQEEAAEARSLRGVNKRVSRGQAGPKDDE